MATQGSTSVDFGTGALEVSVAVTGQAGITTANLVEAWALCNDVVGSSNNDAAWVEQLQVHATYIVNATGFTIIAKPNIGRAFGTYNVGWIWN